MSNENPELAEELLAHQAFVTRLATGLAGRDADDLVQDVWRRALERPPQRRLQLREWLTRLTRNLAIDRWREDARRQESELQAARLDGRGSALEARLEIQREIVDAVDTLRTPFREAILLRYFEGLPPREIAVREGVPLTTVKKRLQRGLGELREGLDRRYGGDRTRWMPAITAMSVPAHTWSATGTVLLGGGLMGTTLKLSAAALAVVICVLVATRSQRSGPDKMPVQTASSEAARGGEISLLPLPSGSEQDPEHRRRAAADKPANGAGSRVLRLVLNGVSEDYGQRATVSVTALSDLDGSSVKLTDRWDCTGSTSEFDLDALLDRLRSEGGQVPNAVLAVTVAHPQHFDEEVSVPLADGVKLEDGRTLHEVSVSLTPVIYWPEFDLVVRDATTGAHLDGVELRCAPTAFMGLVQQPGADGPFTIIGAELSSPIGLRGGRRADLPEGQASGLALTGAPSDLMQPVELVQPEETGRGIMVYARAPGYAWGRIVLDVSKGATRELFLERGASLSLRITNVQPEQYAALGKRATLRVKKIDQEGSEETAWSSRLDAPIESEALVVDSLETGRFVVSVELSASWRRKPVELVRTSIFLRAGEVRDLLLTLPDAPEEPPHVALGGTISFPVFGGEERVKFEFYRSDYRYGEPDHVLEFSDLQPVAAPRPTWSFLLEDLPVDRYQIRVVPFLKSWMVELPSGGRDDLHLEIPQLAEVFVETVDPRSHERIPLQSIAFRVLEVLPDQVTHGGSGPWRTVEFEDHPGRFRFWTVPGAVALKGWGNTTDVEFGQHAREFQLVPGLQSIQLEQAPACLFRFEFRVDGAPLPHEDGVFVGLSRHIQPVGHEGRVGGLYPYCFVEASAPGVYEVRFEGVDHQRFLPISPRRIEAREGETTEVVVDLQRK